MATTATFGYPFGGWFTPSPGAVCVTTC